MQLLWGKYQKLVTNHLESEISFEELIISWSHGYTRKGMLRKTCGMSQGMEAGDISLELMSGWR